MVAKTVVEDRLAVMDDRLRALQASTARDAAQAFDGHAALARAVAQQATDHAVLAQWMKDWTTEVAAWRKCMEDRLEAVDGHQATTSRDLEQARGAMRVAVWVFGATLTLVTGVLSGVLVRVITQIMSTGGR